MKKRSEQSPSRSRHSPEFKGVVKKMAGQLTSDPALEEEGRREMMKPSRGANSSKRTRQAGADPYRRG